MPASPDQSEPRRRRRGRSAVRTGAGVLLCPRCGIPLRSAEHKLGIAWRCGVCMGQSLNFSQFRRMVPEKGANDVWLEAISRPVSPREATDCPECQGVMDAVLIPFRSRMVELDICRRCQRLWLDRQPSAGDTALSLTASPDEGASAASAREELDRLITELESSDSRRAGPGQKVFSSLFPAALAAVLAWTFSGEVQTGPRFLIAAAAAWAAYAVHRWYSAHT